MTKSPNWTRDELILALDLYMRVNPAKASQNHPDIIALSKILNALPIHVKSARNEKFRNVNGVRMKLSNFLRLDPNYQGNGLERGSKLEEQIWKEFAHEPEHLRAIAFAIRSSASLVPQPTNDLDLAIDMEEEFSEGRILTQLHKRRERNPSVVRKKKELVLKDKGNLACEACGFDFYLAYGELGRGYAECHHLLPLSGLTGVQKTKLNDLAIVCSNCHRMLHRHRPWMAVEELRVLLGNAEGGGKACKK